jgi:hypothetical protein
MFLYRTAWSFLKYVRKDGVRMQQKIFIYKYTTTKAYLLKNKTQAKKSRYFGLSSHQPHLIRMRQTPHSYINTNYIDSPTVHTTT